MTLLEKLIEYSSKILVRPTELRGLTGNAPSEKWIAPIITSSCPYGAGRNVEEKAYRADTGKRSRVNEEERNVHRPTGRESGRILSCLSFGHRWRESVSQISSSTKAWVLKDPNVDSFEDERAMAQTELALPSGRLQRCALAVLLLFLGNVACGAEALRRPPSLRSRPRPAQIRVGGATWTQSYSWETRWYEQRLDHFSSRNATFQQKFLLRAQEWGGAESKAPIFLYCGNEGNIEWFAENTGFLFDIAPRYKALLVFPEHRYYGESMPFGSQQAAYKDADSLAYLNTEQALGDFVTLITDLKRNLSAEACPVVLFGGSYGGMLAAWMRLKYPHIAIGALSSSAPILQFEDVASPYSFTDTVSANFKAASESCYQTIRDSWTLMERLGSTKEGLRKLSSQFHMCTDLHDSGELGAWTDNAYAYVSMVNYPYPSSFLQNLPAYPINEMCKAMDSIPESDAMARIFAAMDVYYNYTGDLACFDIYDDPHGMSGWDWQACTEMVMPQSNRNTSMYLPFEWNFEDFAYWCEKNYGVRPRSHWIVEEFGGHDIEAVLKRFGSNIVFSNGLVDPWSGGGVLKNISDSIVALVTAEGAHHLDLRAIQPEVDPQWLVDQRNAELQHIDRWLLEFYADRDDGHAEQA
ncbi:hypothetical protein Mp_4g05680 [Marchantia polymorpha subsp. ruderalis]|uniref:Lysosomal Pro-X carboxypeptidase n=2 Tax=Marchantia polymorpha TaxID=3197 RepID=A0AAF6B6Q7_MARPO|nr:hypothetical protein MARPO_0087s0023 [Marchantia polymorpha]BBN07691.1 hypothetical protein Mp_4g05680 [Marchantia polymorpha subsp. ruderalis]|eukprot:PTQ33582.1 hypothetical protein MARPO_0087s0023 [Marchantia polymorpha]